MINKIYRLIYISSLTIMGLFLILMVFRYFFPSYFTDSSPMYKILGILTIITPFAPIGTLFGTLKEKQSTQKKMTILIGTGFFVLLLIFFIWAVPMASALA